MQKPTCVGIRVRSVRDAHLIFHAVTLGILPKVTRRLDAEERRAVCAGNVYVWEERGRNAEATGLGIERWTDGLRWSASRVRDEFLLYHERGDSTELDYAEAYGQPGHIAYQPRSSAHTRLVKQTYSVFVETTRGQRKWHMTAYFIPATVDRLRTVDDIPGLSQIRIPAGMYTSAKLGKGRAHDSAAGRSDSGDGGQSIQSPTFPPSPIYTPYAPGSLHTPDIPSNTFPPPLPFPQSGLVQPYYDNTRGMNGSSLPMGSSTSSGGPSPFVFPPNKAKYLPRHPLDDAALKALKGL